jgi:hypothetical protein
MYLSASSSFQSEKISYPYVLMPWDQFIFSLVRTLVLVSVCVCTEEDEIESIRS